MHPVLAAAIAKPRFAKPYGSNADDTRYDLGGLVTASDTYIKHNSCGWNNGETDQNARRTIASGRARAIGTYGLN